MAFQVNPEVMGRFDRATEGFNDALIKSMSVQVIGQAVQNNQNYNRWNGIDRIERVSYYVGHRSAEAGMRLHGVNSKEYVAPLVSGVLPNLMVFEDSLLKYHPHEWLRLSGAGIMAAAGIPPVSEASIEGFIGAVADDFVGASQAFRDLADEGLILPYDGILYPVDAQR